MHLLLFVIVHVQFLAINCYLVPTHKLNNSSYVLLYSYNIISGNSDNYFCIDGAGTITVARLLKGQIAATYQLEVSVKFGTLGDKCVVNIKVFRASLAPHFTKSLYVVAVPEDKG